MTVTTVKRLSKVDDINIVELLSTAGTFELSESVQRNNAVVRVKHKNTINNVAVVKLITQELNNAIINFLQKEAIKINYRFLGLYECTPQLLGEIKEKYKKAKNDEVFSDTEKQIGFLINKALEIKASDIHIQLNDSTKLTDISMRVDGLMRHVHSYSFIEGEQILNSLYQRAGSGNQGSTLNFSKKTSFQIEWERKKHKSIRVECSPNALYFKSIWRLLTPVVNQFMTYKDLGYDKYAVEFLERLTHLNSGAIIFTGPVGSGKSTSMYSQLKKIIENHTDSNGNITKVIASIEDPVEQVLPFGADQREINSNVKNVEEEYSKEVSSLVRSDPDTVVLGEIRYMVQANVIKDISEIGNTAYGTMHADKHVGAIRRLYNKFGFDSEFFAVNGPLKAIISQRLVPVICDHCSIGLVDLMKKKDRPKYFSVNVILGIKKSISYYLKDYAKLNNNLKIANRNSDCKDCGGSGYSGRTLIYEIFSPNKSLTNVVNHYENKKFVEGYEAYMNADHSNGIDGITIGERCLNLVLIGKMCAFDGAKMLASYPVSERRLIRRKK